MDFSSFHAGMRLWWSDPNNHAESGVVIFQDGAQEISSGLVVRVSRPGDDACFEVLASDLTREPPCERMSDDDLSMAVRALVNQSRFGGPWSREWSQAIGRELKRRGWTDHRGAMTGA